MRKIDSTLRPVAHERFGAARSWIRKLRITYSFPSFSAACYAFPIVQFPEGRRLVDHCHDDDGGIIAWQLFEVAAQNRIGRENRDADHEGWPAPTADRDYTTGRSPMTTRRAVGAPPRINPRSTVLPMLSGPSSRMISRTRSIGFPFQAVTISPTRIPARADGPFGSMLTTRTPRRLSVDCDPMDARSCLMGWRPAPR